MGYTGYAPFADLRGANLTGRAVGATENGDIDRVTVEKDDDAEKGSVEKLNTATALTSVSAQGLQLSGVDLRSADMRGSNLRGTILTEARLEWADLLTANLTQAELAGARMDHADLLGANLASADMSGASLKDANLSQANLAGAELQYADLTGAQGLTLDSLTSTRNWCNAFYALPIERALGLPPGNDDRVTPWRQDQESVIREYPGAAESARVEQLSRLFPGTDTEKLLSRFNVATLESAGGGWSTKASSLAGR
jgi:hypothetical protein